MCNSPNMLYCRTIAHSVRERGELLRDDRFRVRKKEIATAIQQHVDLPHAPVTDHYAAATGRQSCSAICSWGEPRSLLSCFIGLSIVCVVRCVRTQKNVPVILRVHERQKKRRHFRGTYVQKKPLVLKEGKSSYLLPPEKKIERPPRAPESTDRAETWTNVSGRASRVRVFPVLPKSARAKRKVGKSTKN